MNADERNVSVDVRIKVDAGVRSALRTVFRDPVLSSGDGRLDTEGVGDVCRRYGVHIPIGHRCIRPVVLVVVPDELPPAEQSFDRGGDGPVRCPCCGGLLFHDACEF